MMDKLSFFKLLRGELKKFGQEINFTLDKSRTLIREKEAVLHIINFDPGTVGFACDIAIQPLYVPEDYLVLSLGNRIGVFAADVAYQERYSYGSTKEEAMENIKKVEDLLRQYGLPWFEEAGTPQKLINFLESDRSNLLFRCPDWLTLIYKGMSFLKLGEIKFGTKDLIKAKVILEDMPWDWAQKDVKLITDMVELAHQGGQSVVQKLLEFEKYTREKLKMRNSASIDN